MEFVVPTTQLVGAAVGIMAQIKMAVETARQNKVECDHLKDRLPTIGHVLHRLPPDAELERLLAELIDMLQQAYDLIVACQKRSAANRLFRASVHADRLRSVNARIDSHLAPFPLISYATIAHRLDEPGRSCPASPASKKVKNVFVAEHEREILDIFPLNHTGVPELDCSSGGSLQNENVEDAFVEQCKILGMFPANHTGEVPAGCSSAASLHDMQAAFVAEHHILDMFPPSHNGEVPGYSSTGSLQEVDNEFVAERKILVYEHGHMSDNTLRDHLVHGVSSSSPVTVSWRTRVEVLLGASRAIEHLHRCVIIHGNVSSTNIRLDANWMPRLSGFLSAQDLQADQLVAVVVGTPGYIDPEYRRTGRMRPASDVYSFGVVILEALTGRPPVSGSSENGDDAVTLVDSMLPIIRDNKLRDVLDGRPVLQPMLRQLEALELVSHTARLCLWPHGKDRPFMSDVVANLEKALGIIRSLEPMKLL